MKSFEELGIDVKTIKTQGKTVCPSCSHKRKKKDEPCLSVNTETGQYHCFNCGWAGGTKPFDVVKQHFEKKEFTIPKYDIETQGISDKVKAYLVSRGISSETQAANYIASDSKNNILFPYIKGQVVNVKTRSLDKTYFSLVRGAEICFYGIQNLFDEGILATNKIFITEGEIDALSLYQCGFRFALSVPNGANMEEEGQREITPKLEFLEDSDIAAVLEAVEEVVLVTDSDYKGKRLRDELASRIGVSKCFSVEYPSDCKDINDVLVQHGEDKVIETILDAQPMLQGIVTVNSQEDALIQYYQHGLQEGLKSGIEAFDEIYTLERGLITLVTGIPEIKKSVLLDNLMRGYARENDLHVASFSPETKPLAFHIGRISSIDNGKSLSRNAENRMSYEEFRETSKWVDKHFTFLQPKYSTIEEILELARLCVLKYGTKILVIDPYSRIRVDAEAEDKFIRRMLNDISEFAARYGVHVFIVAHPTKIETLKKPKGNEIVNYPIVTPYQIKGASEWFQSADFILSLNRDLTMDDSPTLVYVLKSKLWHIAKGNQYCELDYDYSNWRFSSRGLLTNSASL